MLRGLFYDIVVGGSYAAPETGASTESLGLGFGETDPSVMITELLQKNGTLSGDPFEFRGQIAKVVKLSDNTVLSNQLDDRSKEEVIGKIANLLTVRQNFFTVIVAAEAVDDKLTYYKGGLRGRFDYGIDKIYSKERVMAVFYRDAIKNAFRTDLFDYIDEQ